MSQRFAVNCSIMFGEVALLERPAAAAAAGFSAVEFWWPFASATPTSDEVNEFCSAIESAGVQLIGLNFFAGDMPAGDRGVVSHPARRQEFRDSVVTAVQIAQRLECRAFNALYGNRLAEVSADEQDETALDNLVFAAHAVKNMGGVVLVEPISGSPAYPLKTSAACVDVIDQAAARGVDNLRLLYDIYHLAANDGDIWCDLNEYYDRFGHVQVADFPGRAEPGTGKLDVAGVLAELERRGWRSPIALEYKPSGVTTDSFSWLAGVR